MLQRQQEEERQLLEDKVNTISNLQQQIEEYVRSLSPFDLPDNTLEEKN